MLEGRWVNRDPIEENGGVNLYGHCNNNPAGCTDSRGLGFTGGEDVFVGGVDALRGNPLPGQLGSEYLDYFNLLSCVSCGGGCEKPIVAFDTGVFGYCEWLSKYADKRMRSGRTVKFHEQEHLINDWQMIQ
jgi:hypothetical protein